LWLTTQVSNLIQIGRNKVRPALKRERYTISFVRQPNTITKENIPLLKLLDAVRYIKKIPDTTLPSACSRLLVLLGELSESEEKSMVRLSQKYPPATRALLGAILDQLGRTENLNTLQSSLNPITQYKMKGAAEVLKTTEKWNIV
jgi:hypothetical protein